MSERTALYRLFAQDATLLYVGIAKRFGRRWEQHAKTQPWWSHVDHQTVHWLPGREEALAAEKQAIKAERPVYNIAGSPWQGGIKDDGTGFYTIPKPPRQGPAAGGRPRTGQTPIHAFRIADNLWNQVREVASDEGRDVTAVVVDALRRYAAWYARQRRSPSEG